MLSNLKNTSLFENCIIVGDLNIIEANAKKTGGFFGRDPFRNNLEEIILDWDLMEFPPWRGKYTWINMRVGLGHIDARLDCFIVHNNLLHHNPTIKSHAFPSLISDHKPISLYLQALPNFPPFLFGLTPCGFNIKK
jgi:exonuclease III